jgi:hypothetical protein
MRRRADDECCDEIVIDQNDIAKSHSYVGVMNERITRDSEQRMVAFAVDTDGHQRWQVMLAHRNDQARCFDVAIFRRDVLKWV